MRANAERPGRRIACGKRSHEVVVDLLLTHPLAANGRFIRFALLASHAALRIKPPSTSSTDERITNST